MNNVELIAELNLTQDMNVRQLAEAIYSSVHGKTLKASTFTDIVFLVNPSGVDQAGRQISTSDKCWPWYKNHFNKLAKKDSANSQQRAQFILSLNNLKEKEKNIVLAKLAQDNLDLLLSKVDLAKYLPQQEETISE